ncbi:MAG: cysteine hydrolase [Eubacteriales bacterium]|nr:cysteine hydrolase [Eubacteriales bacterium]
MMKPDAIIVIDVQTELVEAHPYQEKTLIRNLQTLLSACRAQGVPVIYVQHSDEDGRELRHGTPGWKIARAIAPKEGEPTFEKHHNSAFHGTDLHEHLQAMSAKNLLICGMQTEYCVDTSVKAAFELGYSVFIPEGATGTFDNEVLPANKIIDFYENRIWNGERATVVSMEAALAGIQG